MCKILLSITGNV